MHKLLLILSLLLAWNLTLAEGLSQLNNRPNILLILLDDLGYADLGVIAGKEDRTPYINKLARQGVLFRHHYTDATCMPTRVGIMTGQHPSHYGFRPIHIGLSPDTKTLANSLQGLGYATYHLGKWHIGNGSIHENKYTPETIGFNGWFGFRHQFLLSGPTQDYIHYGKETYYNPWLEGSNQPARQYQGHLNEIITQKAVEWIEAKATTTTTPWFLNLWYFAPHSPFEPERRFAEKYSLTDIGQRDALIEQVDFNIGRVLSALEKSGLENKTLVFLLSDNGGPFQENNQPLYGIKGQFYQGGIRTPLILRWPGHLPENRISDDIVSIFDIFATVAAATGISAPNNINAHDLISLIDGNPEQQNSGILFWEYQNHGLTQLAVLSQDGHWQLVYDWKSEKPKLFDLHNNPAGNTDVYENNQAIANSLMEKYYTERFRNRIVNFNYMPKSSAGHAVLTGQETQRSPGYQSFTFGIAVIPDKRAQSEPQFIVQQESVWRLVESNEGIELTLGDQKLKGPKLEAGTCHSIIVTADYRFSILKPEENQSIVEFFVNGKLVGSSKKDWPTRTLEAFGNPTLIGLEPSGGLSFTGKLSQPIILNERVVESSYSSKLRNDVNTLDQQLCPKIMQNFLENQPPRYNN